MISPSLPTCPKCGQTDQVQKVTSTFAANTTEWKERRSRTDAWGHRSTTEETKRAHTVLGLKLKLPDQPAGPTHPGLWYGIGGLVIFILASALCPVALVPLGFIVPLVGGSTLLPDLNGIPSWAIGLAVILIPTLCVVGLGVVLLIWLGRKAKARFDRDMQGYREKRQAFERDELPRWQGAKSRWEQLYYCMRDETVFIPAEKKAIQADDMVKYLYDPQFRSAP